MKADKAKLTHIKQALAQTYSELIKEVYQATQSACKHSGLADSVDEVFNSVIIESMKDEK